MKFHIKDKDIFSKKPETFRNSCIVAREGLKSEN